MSSSHHLKQLFLATALLTSGSALIAGPSAGPDLAAIRAEVLAINAGFEIHSIEPAPLAGLNAVRVDETVLYVSDDGRYILSGVLLDTKTHTDVTATYVAQARARLLASVPESDKIVFSPANPKYTVTVFTDTSCGYCRALHKASQSYMDAGIAVAYVPWPRGGTSSPSYGTMQSVWCSATPKKAYAEAITGSLETPDGAQCDRSDDFKRLYALGQDLGIRGTPAIFDASGRHLGGYLSAANLLAALKDSP